MKIIQLSQGYIAVIDTSEYSRVSKYKWHAEISRDKLRVYARTDIDGRKVRLHRFVMNATEGQYVDHKGGNSTTLDCRKSNLRFIDKSGNAANSKVSKCNTSGYRGVYHHQGKWRASVIKDGKRISLGVYEKIEHANEAVIKERKKIWG